jgi:hypothetical protein
MPDEILKPFHLTSNQRKNTMSQNNFPLYDIAVKSIEIQNEQYKHEQEQQKQKREYESRLAECQAELAVQISNYNTVVTNTLNKFRSEPGIVDSELYIPRDAVIVKAYTPYTATEPHYVFQTSYGEKKIPVSLFMNDPIKVAQYTRKLVRKYQAEARRAELKNLQVTQAAAEKQLAKAQAEANEAAREVERIAARIEAQKKREAKKAARQEAVTA